MSKKIETKNINFSNYQGGVICEKCKFENTTNTKIISYESMELMGVLINSYWDRAKKYSSKIQQQTLNLLESFTQYQLENKIKSLKYLNIYEANYKMNHESIYEKEHSLK